MGLVHSKDPAQVEDKLIKKIEPLQADSSLHSEIRDRDVKPCIWVWDLQCRELEEFTQLLLKRECLLWKKSFIVEPKGIYLLQHNMLLTAPVKTCSQSCFSLLRSKSCWTQRKVLLCELVSIVYDGRKCSLPAACEANRRDYWKSCWNSFNYSGRDVKCEWLAGLKCDRFCQAHTSLIITIKQRH